MEKHDPEYLQLVEENRCHVISHEPIELLRKPLVSEHLYHDIFVKEFSIHFGYPRTDSCSTHDTLHIAIEAATDTQRPLLEKQLKEHQQLAKDGYRTFQYDQEFSKQSWEKTKESVEQEQSFIKLQLITI